MMSVGKEVRILATTLPQFLSWVGPKSGLAETQATRSCNARFSELLENLSLLGAGVGWQTLAIGLEIILIHYHRTSIHEHWDGRCQGRAPIFGWMYRVMVQVVQEF